MYVVTELGRDKQCVTITNRKGLTSHNTNVQFVDLFAGYGYIRCCHLFDFCHHSLQMEVYDIQYLRACVRARALARTPCVFELPDPLSNSGE